MEFQAGAAAAAIGEMLFIIPAHFRGDPGNVIPPARQNRANNAVGTLNFRHSLDSPVMNLLNRRALHFESTTVGVPPLDASWVPADTEVSKGP
jgi:hypothetical protein